MEVTNAKKTIDFQEKSELDFSQVEKQVRELMKAMVENAAPDISEADWPQILPAPDFLGTSAYDPEKNIIYIHESHYGSGATYGEEISHFIREYICKKYSYDEPGHPVAVKAVEEFFGRLGENIAREKSDQSDLFNEAERKFHGNEELLDKIAKEIAEAKPIVEKINARSEKDRQKKEQSKKMIASFREKLSTAMELCDQAIQDQPLPEEIFRQLKDLLAEGENGLREMIVFVKSTSENGTYPRYVKEILKLIENISGQFSDMKGFLANKEIREGTQIYELFKICIESMQFHSEWALDDFSFPNLDLLSVIMEQESKLGHLLGYAAAERYMQTHSDWQKELPQLFAKSNEEVISNYIDNEDFEQWATSQPALNELSGLLEMLYKLHESESEDDDLDEVDSEV